MRRDGWREREIAERDRHIGSRSGSRKRTNDKISHGFIDVGNGACLFHADGTPLFSFLIKKCHLIIFVEVAHHLIHMKQ